jgi:pyridoxal phosphate enzyme (YggS family)
MTPTSPQLMTQNWNRLITEVGVNTSVVAAVKYGSAIDAATLIRAGAQIIGENRVQDAEHRYQELAQMELPPYTTHLIGTLQTNKVKKAMGLFSCIQSLDRLSLMEAIQKEACQQSIMVSGMIQINSGNEVNKSGFLIDETIKNNGKLFAFPNIQIIGIMIVAPFFSNAEESRPYFKKANALFQELRYHYPQLVQLSMGMSHDYSIAIQEGATMIRIGSVLYGQ